MGDGQISLEQRSCRTLCTTTNGCTIVAYSFSPRTAKAQKRVENPSAQATYDGRRSGSLEQRSCRTLCTTTNGCSIVAYSFSPRTAKAQKRVENPSAQATYDGRRSGFFRATKLSDALQNNERMHHCCVLVLSTHDESAETRRELKRAGSTMGDGRFSQATKLSDALHNNERMHHCCVLVLSTHDETAWRKRAGYLRWATVRLLSSNEAVGRFAEQRTDAPLLRTRSLHARRKRRGA